MTRELLDSQKIYTGAVFEVVRDRFREASGQEIVRDVVRHVGGAGGVPLFADGRIALVRQYRHPAGRDLLEIPAGKLDADEAPELCAAREIEEELGVRVGKLEKLAEFYSTPGFCEEKLFVYLATELEPGQQNLDHDEAIEIVYLTLEEALQLVERGEIEDAKTIIALLLTRQKLAVMN
ncbi:MAG TPA: NUDIX hydrolase [Blastocatellia bacterium]|nr:NUDIX hydrolase [Blastocatellia bacterium]